MNDLRQAAQQALEALQYIHSDTNAYEDRVMAAAITALEAALAEPTVKESLQVESAFAENATTQQQLEEAPPSDYRRGYWDGFEIGKREGRIEAENALAEPNRAQKLTEAGYTRRPTLREMAEPEPCQYPDCVDNGPDGKCTRWLLGECSKSEDYKPHRPAEPVQENKDAQ